jgi:glycosyltransferase involved in cell wall biosynthesis
MNSQKIKIIYIIDGLVIGGAQRLLVDLIKALDKSLLDIKVVTLIKKGILAEEIEKLGIPVIFQPKTSKLGLGLVFKLRKFLKAESPDIVHTHLFGGDTWGRLAAILAKVPVIISTEHNINLNESFVKKLVKLLLSFFTNKIIAVSQGAKDYAVEIEKIKAAKISVIYNGLDTDIFTFRGFKPIDLSLPIQAVVVARLEEQKGHQYLLEAMPLILNKYANFNLNIIGSGSLEQDLKLQVEKLKIKDHVVFWGEQLELGKILPAMDLFILPSVWEGLGIVILEAQAIGLPVIASNVGGIREVVEDTQTGLLFEPKNPTAIFNAVDKLLSSQDLAQQIVSKANKQITEKFNIKIIALAYSNLYFDLVK